MVSIDLRFKDMPERAKLAIGKEICESLKGCDAFINNKIVVNYDGDPKSIMIFFGDKEPFDFVTAEAKVVSYDSGS